MFKANLEIVSKLHVAPQAEVIINHQSSSMMGKYPIAGACSVLFTCTCVLLLSTSLCTNIHLRGCLHMCMARPAGSKSSPRKLILSALISKMLTSEVGSPDSAEDPGKRSESTSAPESTCPLAREHARAGGSSLQMASGHIEPPATTTSGEATRQSSGEVDRGCLPPV